MWPRDYHQAMDLRAMKQIDLTIDVTEAADLGEPAHIAATVCLPPSERLTSPATVCFAKPGGGFSRRYFTTDLPGPARGSQAEWHTERGWIFVAVDHLGVGDSSTHHDPARLGFGVVAAASAAAEKEIMKMLATGGLSNDFPPLEEAVTLGIGQSMGGCLTVVQQGRHHSYDGIGVLGFSAVHTHPPAPPGEPPIVAAWRLPAGSGGVSTVLLNQRAFTGAYRDSHGTDPSPTDILANGSPAATLWHFYYDDVLEYLPPSSANTVSPWVSTTIPGLISCVLTPGIIAPEAAAVETPVLIAMGERDVVTDPAGEPRAYLSAPSVDLFTCPRMGHMHNFAGTRQLFWKRIHTWGEWIRDARH